MSDRFRDANATLVTGLGGASLGLGVTEVLAPGKVAAVAGVANTNQSRSVIRALGIRECGHAAGLLLGSPKLVWTRVAGDVLDMALLAAGIASRPRGRRRRGTICAAALAVIGAADLYAALRITTV
jgi:hypothetical protein